RPRVMGRSGVKPPRCIGWASRGTTAGTCCYPLTFFWKRLQMRSVLLMAALGVVLGTAGPARADERSDAEAVLDKGIKALGGEANLTKFKPARWKAKGKLHVGDETADFSGEWALQAPDKFRVALEVTGKQGTLKQVRVLNGDKGWIKIDNDEA